MSSQSKTTTFPLLVPATSQPSPPPDGLKDPRSVAVGPDGRVHVTVAAPGKDGGAVVALDKGKVVPVAAGLQEPRGLAAFRQALFVVDKAGVWRIDLKGKLKGKAQPFAAADGERDERR